MDPREFWERGGAVEGFSEELEEAGLVYGDEDNGDAEDLEETGYDPSQDDGPGDESNPFDVTPRGFYSPCAKALFPGGSPRLFRPEDPAELSPARTGPAPHVYETPPRQGMHAAIQTPGGSSVTITPPRGGTVTPPAP